MRYGLAMLQQLQLWPSYWISCAFISPCNFVSKVEWHILRCLVQASKKSSCVPSLGRIKRSLKIRRIAIIWPLLLAVQTHFEIQCNYFYVNIEKQNATRYITKAKRAEFVIKVKYVLWEGTAKEKWKLNTWYFLSRYRQIKFKVTYYRTIKK